jgi:hypothetical protein
LTEEELRLVKEVDDAVLYYDMLELFGVTWGEKSELEIKPDYTILPFEEVEQNYLALFEKLS